MRVCVCECVDRSGLVEECLTRDPRAAGSSLTGNTALCPRAKPINSLFGGIWGEAELILGILFGEHRRNTFRELRNLFHEFGEINALFLGSKGT